jgi:heptosyltransferase-3
MKLPTKENYLYLFNTFFSRWINLGKNKQTFIPKNILCIKYDEIGDMAACTHVFSLLKKRYPNAFIHVITKEYCAPLLKNNPNIHQISTSINDWNKKYDLIVELRGTWKSLWKTLQYYPKMRLDRGTVRWKQRGNQPHETITNYRIIEPILNGIPNETPTFFPGDENYKKVEAFIENNQLENFCVLHVGARSVLRRWTNDGFATIADWLYENRGLKIVFAGTVSEENQIQEITNKMRSPFALFTRNFYLLDLAAMLQKASLFLGNESGPLQIADGMQTPIVGLFGPGVTNVFYPQNKNAGIIHHVLNCNPCDQIHCVNPSYTCMQRISIEEVKSKIEEILK